MTSTSKSQTALMLGGYGMVIASLFHIVCMIGGSKWVAFAGAPPHIVKSFEDGTLEGPIVTVAIAGVLTLWALYAFSGAGKIGKLPLLKTGIAVIGALLILRGLAFPWMVKNWEWQNLIYPFHALVSVIVLLLGICYLYGLYGMMKKT